MLEFLVIFFTALFISGIVTIAVGIWYLTIILICVAFVMWAIELIFGKKK